MPLTMPPFARHTLLSALAAFAATGNVYAEETRPYYLGVAETFSHETNVRRDPDARALADNVSSTTVLVGADLTLSRQHLKADARVTRNAYSDHDWLDNTSYSASAGLDWETVAHLKGTLKASSSRSLAHNSIALFPGLPPAERLNVTTRHLGEATATYGLSSLTQVNLEFAHVDVGYSDPYFARLEHRTTDGSVDLTHEFGGQLKLGIGASGAKGKRPKYRQSLDGSYLADEFTREGVDLKARWTPSAASALTARVSAYRTRHTSEDALDSSGTAAALVWEWQPTGHLSFKTQLSHDSGERQADTLLAPDGTGLARRTTRGNLAAHYQLTGKVLLQAAVDGTRRQLAQSFAGLASPIEGSDRTVRLSVGATWNALRWLQLGCNVSRDERRASDTPLSYDYTSNSASCYAQAVID